MIAASNERNSKSTRIKTDHLCSICPKYSLLDHPAVEGVGQTPHVALEKLASNDFICEHHTLTTSSGEEKESNDDEDVPEDTSRPKQCK
jgi:hypothetical protein